MRFIRLNENNQIVSIRYDEEIVMGEIESETGDLGQIMQEDGTFITPEIVVEPQPNEPTNAEIAQMISDLQADLIIAGVI